MTDLCFTPATELARLYRRRAVSPLEVTQAVLAQIERVTIYPTEINGKPMENYIQWVLLTYAFTVVGSPAISVPAGFTRDGLPVGLQIAGRARDEAGILRIAAAFEAAQPWAHLRPPGV